MTSLGIWLQPCLFIHCVWVLGRRNKISIRNLIYLRENRFLEAHVTYWLQPISIKMCLKPSYYIIPDSKVHGANMGPTLVLSAPDGPHVGPMNLAIGDINSMKQLTGTPLETAAPAVTAEDKERWHYCVDLTNDYYGFAVSRFYVPDVTSTEVVDDVSQSICNGVAGNSADFPAAFPCQNMIKMLKLRITGLLFTLTNVQ